jgi:hypothetical protein
MADAVFAAPISRIGSRQNEAEQAFLANEWLNAPLQM